MRKIRQIIRLQATGKSIRFISKYLDVSRNTVKYYLWCIKQNGYTHDYLLGLSDMELQKHFEPKPAEPSDRLQCLYSHFPKMEKKLMRPGITKQQVWREYRAIYPSGYSRSQFCHHYMQWKKRSSPTMHMEHTAGEKMYVDYTGKKLSIIDRATGEIRDMEVFVAILGSSQLTYVQAIETQGKEDFITCVENTLIYFGGVPQAIVPDNLKSAVTRSNRYEPTLNECFQDFAEHYQTTVLPARVRKPRDKSLAEGAVRIIYTRIFVPLQQKTFYSLEELNKSILSELDRHNNTPFQGRKYSRRDLFNEVEKEALSALPANRYEIKHFAVGTVYKISHVYMGKDKHYYSVPYEYIGKKIKIIYSKSHVWIYHKYKLIADHKRDKSQYRYTTVKQHLPTTHQYIRLEKPVKLTT